MDQDELIKAAAKCGVRLRTRYCGVYFGWTTDEEKAKLCRLAGLTVEQGYNQTGPPGWEIRAPAMPPTMGEDTSTRKGTGS